MTLIKKTFSIPIYECKISYIVTSNIDKQYKTLCKKFNLPMEVGEAYGFMLRPDTMEHYYVVLKEEGLNYNTVGHELRHLEDYILADRNFDLKDYENSSYLSGYILKTFMDFVKDKNVIIK